jgi:hypothetical protein
MYWLMNRHRSDAATRQASSHRGMQLRAPALALLLLLLLLLLCF